jgi:hypothetical protein
MKGSYAGGVMPSPSFFADSPSIEAGTPAIVRAREGVKCGHSVPTVYEEVPEAGTQRGSDDTGSALGPNGDTDTPQEEDTVAKAGSAHDVSGAAGESPAGRTVAVLDGPPSANSRGSSVVEPMSEPDDGSEGEPVVGDVLVEEESAQPSKKRRRVSFAPGTAEEDGDSAVRLHKQARKLSILQVEQAEGRR